MPRPSPRPARLPSRSLCGLLLALVTAAAGAQEIDPLLQSAEFEDQPVRSAWRATGDLALRAESTHGFSNREDIERLRSRLRAGLVRDDGTWTLRAVAKFGLGSDDNADNLRNLDNEKSDGVGIDEFAVGWRGDTLQWQLGKSVLPLAFTPLTWDRDLRPIGASLQHERPIGDFHRFVAQAGYFAPDHLGEDDSRLAAAQFSWFLNEGGVFSGELHAGYWHYDRLESTRRSGLMRSNRVVDGRLASDFELINLQGAVRRMFGERPLELRLDLVDNLGADRDGRGARFSIVYGSALIPGQWEIASAFQRIGRDAVPAAFNEDDWWFHSAARGVMPWIAYGIDETWSLQLSGFFERADGRDERIDRYLLDLRARW
ncbi:putative porin [Pseudomarimonas salicorniae]|uniref:Porin n=1 Tax=Pseudomarimonas salicorniae TaxID=2933270 RepID=A0ABT0GKG5_9GAMM|nr:putative porin [Lysobacter sp. CAU 1642]MCK7594704.1 putative porin [Lysobacter sp. CAU 1642]